MSSADIVVIGGGINGTSAAMHLAKRGVGKVVLIEQGHLASGATGRSTAMIRDLYSYPSLVNIAIESSSFFRNYQTNTGVDIGFNTTGRVLLFGEKDRISAETIVKMNKEMGVDVSIISVEETAKILPEAYLNDVSFGIWEPKSGYADPVLATYAFAEEARSYGAEIITHKRVTGYKIENNQLSGVRTNTELIKTNTVLNVTGAWAKLLDSDLPIRPVRVQVVRIRRPKSLELMAVSVIDNITGANFRSETNFCTRIGGEAPEDLVETVHPNCYGKNADRPIIDRFLERASHRFPAFKDSICLGGFGGIYDITPDGNPIIDRSTKFGGLYFATGFSGHGFKLAPVIGRMIADYITDGGVHMHDLHQFRLTRFSEGDFSKPEYGLGNPAHP